MSTDVSVLYDEGGVLAVDKPAGFTVVPAREEDPDRCLQHKLQRELGARLWVVHRLDRDTTGVLLFARDAEAHRALSLAFEQRRARKRYLAFALGTLGPSGTIALPLHAARKGKMRPAAQGEADALPAETRYRVLASRESLLGMLHFVQLEPRTGRQHQLRVHLRAVGAPLLVDPLYARRETLAGEALGAHAPGLARLALHSSELELTLGEALLHFQAPLPPDLAALEGWVREASRPPSGDAAL